MKNLEAGKRVDNEMLALEQIDKSDALAKVSNGHDYEYGVEAPVNKINLERYWHAIRKRLWLIASITILITLLVTVYVSQKPDYYVATARVQVNLENNPAVGSAKGGFVFQGGYDPGYFSSQLQIIEGSGLLRRVVNTLDLQHNRAFLSPRTSQDNSVWRNVWRTVLRMAGRSSQPPASRDEVTLTPTTPFELSAKVIDDKEVERLAPYVGLLRSGLSVLPVRETRVVYIETRLIDIRYTHTDPHMAAKLANAIADTYVSQNYEQKIDNNATAGDFLQKRIAELQSQIRSNEERLINYARNNQIISLDAGQNTVVQRLSDLNNSLSRAEGDRIMAEAALRSSQVPGAASAQTESDGRATALESRLSDLRNQRVKLFVEYTEEAPEIIEIDKQIALAKQELSETRSRATNTLTTNLDTKYREARAREQDLSRIFNQQRAEVLAQNEAAINYRIIQQDIVTDKSLLDGLLQRSKENDIVLSGTPNNVLLIDRALTPGGPVGPKRGQYVVLAFIASVGLGIGLALLLDYLDDTVRTVDDVERKLHLPALADIPSVGKSKAVLLLTTSVGSRKRDDYSTAVLDLKGKPLLEEAYMHLRTGVLLATAGGPPETLLITSSQPSEGKTTTAINMASVLAQTGVRVLLIDADLRRPSLHMILGFNNNGHDPSKGLSTLLTAKALDEQAVIDSIKFHEESGVFVLTSGPVPPNPANLLYSPQMERLLDILRSKFTHIVLDSPPISFFTDGVLLSRLVDGVLLVVRSGKSHLDMTQRAKKLLWDAGANFFGVVLNDVPRPKQSYYSYGYERTDEIPPSESSLLKLERD